MNLRIHTAGGVIGAGEPLVYAKRVRALEEENQTLEKFLAEAMLSAATLSEMLAKTSKG